jgi:hypothetical protein
MDGWPDDVSATAEKRHAGTVGGVDPTGIATGEWVSESRNENGQEDLRVHICSEWVSKKRIRL